MLETFIIQNPEIPIKIKRFSLKSIMIKADASLYHLNIDNDINIPICTTLYPQIIHERSIALYREFKRAILDVARCSVSTFSNLFDGNLEINELVINECHDPHYNLLPLSCNISRLLFNDIPSNDI